MAKNQAGAAALAVALAVSGVVVLTGSADGDISNQAIADAHCSEHNGPDRTPETAAVCDAPTTTTTLPPTTTTTSPPTTSTTTTTTTTEPPPTGWSEDFSSPDALDRFELGVMHTGTSLGAQDEWPGDHDLECGDPSTERTVTKAGGVDEMVYLCRNHLMTSIGDASAYDIVSVTPLEVFEGITEIRWEQNITDLGGDNDRQFTEVKIIPADVFDPQNLPCAIEWYPCATSTNAELGSVSVSTASSSRVINNGSTYNGAEAWMRPWMYPDDPALDSKAIRRTHYFRDNGDGTLTFGTEIDGDLPPAVSTCGGDCGLSADGAYYEITQPGSFPTGPVRVVFADHTYTPLKDPLSGFTWHWDNLVIE